MRRAVATMAAVVLVLAAAGCADDGGDDGGDDGDGPGSEEEAVSTSVPRFEGDPESSFCTLLREVRLQGVLEEPADSAADVEAGFSQLIGVLTRTAEQAPEELATDVGLVLAGVVALDDALRAVGYSYDALSRSPSAAEVSAAINDPSFAVAGDRIEAYRAQVCNLQ